MIFTIFSTASITTLFVMSGSPTDTSNALPRHQARRGGKPLAKNASQPNHRYATVNGRGFGGTPRANSTSSNSLPRYGTRNTLRHRHAATFRQRPASTTPTELWQVRRAGSCRPHRGGYPQNHPEVPR